MEDPLDDPVQVYLREVTAVPALTIEQEAVCVRDVRARDQEAGRAEKDLVEANLALVVEIAQKYADRPVRVLDLIQIGNVALMQALDTFRESKDDSFPAHAAPRVERAIADAVKEVSES